MLSIAGNNFEADGWAVLKINSECAMELCYIKRLVQCRAGLDDTIYLEVCRFTFEQLKIRSSSNEFHVDQCVLQAVLDRGAHLEQLGSVAPAFLTDLYPSRCRVRGRWLWNLANFEAWNNSEIFRSVQLVGTIRGNLRFIYR